MSAESAEQSSPAIEVLEEISPVETTDEMAPPIEAAVESPSGSILNWVICSWLQEMDRIDQEWGEGLTAMALAALVLAWLLAVAAEFFADWCCGIFTEDIQDDEKGE